MRTRVWLPRQFMVVAMILCVQTSWSYGQGDVPRWPQFRGNNGSGISTASGPLPVEFGKDKNRLWSTKIPHGVSSPCIWDDRIFLTACDSETKVLSTLCLSRSNGEVLWQQSVLADELEKMNSVASPAASTPTSDGQRVFVHFGSYGLLCYDIHGAKQWEYRLPIPKTFEGSGSSPIFVEGLVILVSDQLSDWKRNADGGWDQTSHSFIIALDHKAGEVAWKRERDVDIPAAVTPVVHRQGNSLELLTLGGGRLIAYDLRDGSERWRVGEMAVSNIGTPVIADGHLFFTGSSLHGSEENIVVPPSFDEFLNKHDADRSGSISRSEIPDDYVFVDRQATSGAGNKSLKQYFFRGADRDKSGDLSRREWRRIVRGITRTSEARHTKAEAYAVRLGGESDATDSNIAWRREKGVPEVPSPLHHEGRIYYVSNGGRIFCRSAATGEIIFRGRLGPAGGFYSSPIYGDGKIFCSSDRGVVVVLEPGDKLKVLARNDLEDPIMATPAILDQKIYIRTNSGLHAFKLLSG